MAKDTDNLTTLLERFEENIPQSRRKDAIDAILASEPRTTAARTLRDHEIVQRFRRELSDGFVRADTVKSLLELIREVMDAAAVKP